MPTLSAAAPTTRLPPESEQRLPKYRNYSSVERINFRKIDQGEVVTIAFSKSNLPNSDGSRRDQPVKAKISLQFDRGLTSRERDQIETAVNTMNLTSNSGSVHEHVHAAIFSEIKKGFEPGSDLGLSVAKWTEGQVVENLLIDKTHLGFHHGNGLYNNVIADGVRLDGGLADSMKLQGSSFHLDGAVKFQGHRLAIVDGSSVTGIAQFADLRELVIDSSVRISSDIRASDLTGLRIKVGTETRAVDAILADQKPENRELKKATEEALLTVFSGTVFDDSTKLDPKVREFFENKNNSKDYVPAYGVGFATQSEMLTSLKDNLSFSGRSTFDVEKKLTNYEILLPEYDVVGIGFKNAKEGDGLVLTVSSQLQALLGNTTRRYESNTLNNVAIAEIYGGLVTVARHAHPHSGKKTDELALKLALEGVVKYFRPMAEEPINRGTGTRIIGQENLGEGTKSGKPDDGPNNGNLSSLNEVRTQFLRTLNDRVSAKSKIGSANVVPPSYAEVKAWEDAQLANHQKFEEGSAKYRADEAAALAAEKLANAAQAAVEKPLVMLVGKGEYLTRSGKHVLIESPSTASEPTLYTVEHEVMRDGKPVIEKVQHAFDDILYTGRYLDGKEASGAPLSWSTSGKNLTAEGGANSQHDIVGIVKVSNEPTVKPVENGLFATRDGDTIEIRYGEYSNNDVLSHSHTKAASVLRPEGDRPSMTTKDGFFTGWKLVKDDSGSVTSEYAGAWSPDGRSINNGKGADLVGIVATGEQYRKLKEKDPS